VSLKQTCCTLLEQLLAFRRCYDLESSYINQQKLECLAEMREATEFVDKMRKKQGLMNSFKLATGTNAGTDDIDNKIFNLK
jgi:hypothetical protein